MRRLVPVLLLLALVAPLGRADAARVLYEKNPNLDIARRVASRLAREGVRVVMTRTSDRSVSLAERTGLANRLRTDIFVSIHNNWAGAPWVNWSEVYYQLRGGASGTLATAIGRRIHTHIHTVNRLLTRRGDHGDYYWQLREARMPAVIVESAFVSNPVEARRLATQAWWRQEIADAIAEGIFIYQKTLARPGAFRSLSPGRRVELSALPAPSAPWGSAVNSRIVRLSWRPAKVGDVRVYRDGRLLAELKAGTAAFEDVHAAPGQTYRYEIRTAIQMPAPVAGTPAKVVGESKPVAVSVRTPPIAVCLDPGHGGRDPGALGRY